MLLVRLFILLKLFLFARLRSTDDTMLLTEAGWCRCGWWCRWGATERWQCMVTGRGRRHTGHPPQPRILHRLQCPQSTISCTISQPQLDTTLTLQHTTLYTSPSCKHLTLHLTLHLNTSPSCKHLTLHLTLHITIKILNKGNLSKISMAT